MNDFIYQEDHVKELFFLTLATKIPDHIQAIPSNLKFVRKMMGVVGRRYKIGYNADKWEAGMFDSTEEAGRAFSCAREILGIRYFGNGWEHTIAQLQTSIVANDKEKGYPEGKEVDCRVQLYVCCMQTRDYSRIRSICNILQCTYEGTTFI
jgi:hypothetical protein